MTDIQMSDDEINIYIAENSIDKGEEEGEIGKELMSSSDEVPRDEYVLLLSVLRKSMRAMKFQPQHNDCSGKKDIPNFESLSSEAVMRSFSKKACDCSNVRYVELQSF